MDQETLVVSFVLRFVRADSHAGPEHTRGGWRGVIRHVQSDDERHFTRLGEALAFITDRIEIDDGIAEKEAAEG